MVKLSARLFVLVLNTCFCYTNAFPYQIYNPFHRGIPLPRIVPIKPMNYSTIRRSTHKLPPINPLAEQVFIPKSLQQRYRPEQIMERLTSSASNAHTRKHKNNKFNLLNFDAYTLKPMNLNYNTVLATLTPETERIFKILNRTDVKNDPKVSSSSHRPHHKSNKPHKTHRPKKGGDTFISPFDLRDHPNYQQNKRGSPKKPKQPKKPAFSNGEFTTGFTYFDPDQNKNKFQPVTYAPLPETTFSRPRKHKKPTTNNRIPLNRPYGNTPEPTTMQSVQNVVIQAKPNFINYGTVDDVSTTLETFKHQEGGPHHTAPEMYKFTLEDAVVRPGKHLKKSAALKGPPATSHTFDELSSNIELQTKPTENYDTNYEYFSTEKPKYYYKHTRNNQRNSSKIIRKIERGRPFNTDSDSGRFASRQYRRVEARPLIVTTTENPLTETNGKDELQIKATVEKWPLPLQRHSARSRQEPNRRPISGAIAKITPELLAYESQVNLDVSPSYTKQRTQGVNSAEDVSTTPMTAAAAFFHKQHRALPSNENASKAIKPQSGNSAPQINQAKYFQDIFSEQLTPYNLDYGHLMENPSGWEERYERKNLKQHRHQGKVKWGDKKGGFGEHYYDLNHHLVGQAAYTENIQTR